MNIYEMVERIIELTEKGKIDWQDSCGMREFLGKYKNLEIVVDAKWSRLRIGSDEVYADKNQLRRLARAIKKNIPEGSEVKNGRIQRAYDILKG